MTMSKPPPPQQPMGAENHPVKLPMPERTQLPPGEMDDAAPVTPSPEPDS